MALSAVAVPLIVINNSYAFNHGLVWMWERAILVL